MKLRVKRRRRPPVLVLPRARVLHRLLTFPVTERKLIPRLVRLRLPLETPFPEATLSWYCGEPQVDTAGGTSVRVTLVEDSRQSEWLLQNGVDKDIKGVIVEDELLAARLAHEPRFVDDLIATGVGVFESQLEAPEQCLFVFGFSDHLLALRLDGDRILASNVLRQPIEVAPLDLLQSLLRGVLGEEEASFGVALATLSAEMAGRSFAPMPTGGSESGFVLGGLPNGGWLLDLEAVRPARLRKAVRDLTRGDLLPARWRERRRGVRYLRQLAASAAFTIVLAVCARAALNAYAAELQRAHAAVEAQTTAAIKMIGEYAAAQELSRAVDGWGAGKLDELAVWSTTVEAAPPDVRLTSLSIDERGRIVLRGWAPNRHQVYAFVAGLRQAHAVVFRDVRIESMETSAERQVFQISYDGGALGGKSSP